MTETNRKRKSLDELEKEAWAPEPSMLEEEAVTVTLSEDALQLISYEKKLVNLNGEWELAWDGEEEERLSPERPWEDSFRAQIPCSVHTALYEKGLIPDPTVGLNDRQAREYSYKTWWLKKEFAYDKESGAEQLFFEGICHTAKVWLNGSYLFTHKGMFGRPVYDVGSLLKEHNTLIVKLENAPANPKPMSDYMDNDEGWHDGVVINCVYGWHYACLPSRGIWAPAGLEEKPGTSSCEKPFVSCRSTETGIVDICMKFHGRGGKTVISGIIKGKNHNGKGGSFSYECRRQDGDKVIHLETAIEEKRLWWPVNLGEQNLYTAQLAVSYEDGSEERFETTFGLRTIEMAPLPGGPYEEKHNWTFVVNGRPVFVKGSNWCTLDVLLRFEEKKYRRFLSLAKAQNIQLLRAWGGGMPETDLFYELCDEYGIMVMQEWPTCWDSQKDQPYEELEETVLVHMPRLRNHPSLIMWCGGNESKKADGPAMDMMARYAYELDGSRCFHRTSPWGGGLHNYATYWEMQDIDVSLNLQSAFMGEFGMASAPNVQSVFRYVPEEERDIWPPERFGSFGHHTPRFNQLEPDDMAHLSRRVPEFCRGDSLEQFIFGTQMAQATAIRHTLEAYRCRYPEAAGICYYKLTDVYPACSWSVIDYYGVPKLSYYVIQDSYAPLHACILFHSVRLTEDTSYPVYLLDDAGTLAGRSFETVVKVYDEELSTIRNIRFQGKDTAPVAYLGSVLVKKEESKGGPLFLTTQVWLDGEIADETFYWINYEKKQGSLLTLPPTTLTWHAADGKVRIRNNGGVPAAGVTVECLQSDTEFTVSDSCFWLEPGEVKTVAVSEDKRLTIKAWNAQTAEEKERERL